MWWKKISKLLFALFNLILVRCVFCMSPGMCNITMSRVGIYLINNKNNQHTLRGICPKYFSDTILIILVITTV